MKSLREYIDQIDEISRRDFLKGVGATAFTGATGGAKAYDIDYRRGIDNALHMSQVEANALSNAIALYYLIEMGYIQPNSKLDQALKNLIAIGPAFSQRMNFIYDNVKDNFANKYHQDKNQFLKSVESYKINQDKIVQELSVIRRPF